MKMTYQPKTETEKEGTWIPQENERRKNGRNVLKRRRTKR